MTNQRFPFSNNPQGNIAAQLGYRIDNSNGVGTFSAYKNAAQTVASGDVVTFPAEVCDVSGWFQVGSSSYEPQQSGFYRITSNVAVSTAALTINKHHRTHLLKNGSLYAELGMERVATSTSELRLRGSTIVDADNGDYFQLLYYHDQASDPTLRPPDGHEDNFICGEFISYRGA